MKEGEFEDAVGAEAVRFSRSDFGLVVQALDHAAGKLFFGLEVVEQKFAVSAQSASDLLHRLDAAAHGLSTPEVQEQASPMRRVVSPELLEVLLEQVSADGFQIVAEQIAEAEALFVFEKPMCLNDAGDAAAVN